MEELIKRVFQAAALALEGFGGAVILFAATWSAWRYLANVRLSLTNPASTDGIRVSLGKSLSFSLEFLIGADILRTLITPTLKEISILAATIAIRVALNFFLEREMDSLTRRAATERATP